MSATVTDEQRAAWRCYACGSRRSVGYGMWAGSGPVKAQCVPCGVVSDWPPKPPTEEPKTVDPHDPEYRQRAILFNDITHVAMPRGGHLLMSERQAIADYLYEQGWRRPERPDDVTP